MLDSETIRIFGMPRRTNRRSLVAHSQISFNACYNKYHVLIVTMSSQISIHPSRFWTHSQVRNEAQAVIVVPKISMESHK
jgi:hypothetical protein